MVDRISSNSANSYPISDLNSPTIANQTKTTQTTSAHSNQTTANISSTQPPIKPDASMGRRDIPGQNSAQVEMLRQQLTSSTAGNNIDSVAVAAPTLKRGDKGAGVSELQTKLKAAGYDCGSTAGTFGPITEKMLKSFQRDHNLATTGRFDQSTRAMLDNAVSFLDGSGRVKASFGDSRAARELQAIEILRANKVTPAEGQFYVIQIDQDNPPANAAQEIRDQYLQTYSGQTAVFKCKNGRLMEVSDKVYKSASHPNMTGSEVIGGTVGYQDVDKDGNADIGHMRTGVYQYTRTGERYSPVGSASLPVARDTNHNGVIDGEEAKKKYLATGLQIHAGEVDHPRSAACQTLPPDDYAGLQADLKKNPYKNFTYLLVRRPNDLTGANAW